MTLSFGVAYQEMPPLHCRELVRENRRAQALVSLDAVKEELVACDKVARDAAALEPSRVAIMSTAVKPVAAAPRAATVVRWGNSELGPVDSGSARRRAGVQPSLISWSYERMAPAGRPAY